MIVFMSSRLEVANIAYVGLLFDFLPVCRFGLYGAWACTSKDWWKECEGNAAQKFVWWCKLDNGYAIFIGRLSLSIMGKSGLKGSKNMSFRPFGA